jgi:hypothetical protein
MEPTSRRMARALSSGLRWGAPRSSVAALLERLLGSGRKSLQAPGQRREKNRPGGLAGRGPSPALLSRNDGSPNSVGIAIITMMHCGFSLGPILRLAFWDQEMLSLVALMALLVATVASALPAESHEWYAGLRSPSGMPCCNERDCHPVAYRVNHDTGREEIQANGAWYLELPPLDRTGGGLVRPDELAG